MDATATAACRRVLTPRRKKSKASDLTSVLAPSLTASVRHKEELLHLVTWKAGQFRVCYAHNAASISLKTGGDRWTDRWGNWDCRACTAVDAITGKHLRYNAIPHRLKKTKPGMRISAFSHRVNKKCALQDSQRFIPEMLYLQNIKRYSSSCFCPSSLSCLCGPLSLWRRSKMKITLIFIFCYLKHVAILSAKLFTYSSTHWCFQQYKGEDYEELTLKKKKKTHCGHCPCWTLSLLFQ